MATATTTACAQVSQGAQSTPPASAMPSASVKPGLCRTDPDVQRQLGRFPVGLFSSASAAPVSAPTTLGSRRRSRGSTSRCTKVVPARLRRRYHPPRAVPAVHRRRRDSPRRRLGRGHGDDGRVPRPDQQSRRRPALSQAARPPSSASTDRTSTPSRCLAGGMGHPPDAVANLKPGQTGWMQITQGEECATDPNGPGYPQGRVLVLPGGGVVVVADQTRHVPAGRLCARHHAVRHDPRHGARADLPDRPDQGDRSPRPTSVRAGIGVRLHRDPHQPDSEGDLADARARRTRRSAFRKPDPQPGRPDLPAQLRRPPQSWPRTSR